MVVDANVWVASFVPDDSYHPASRRWLDEQLAGGAILTVPTLVLAEVAGAVARRAASAELGRRAMDKILSTPGLRLVALDGELGQTAGNVAANLGLRGADAVYVAVAYALSVPLVTRDRELLGRASGLIDVSEPSRSA